MSFTGGQWTERKLNALKRYLDAYMAVMKDKPVASRPFKKIYFDAFCGSGERVSTDVPLFEGVELARFSEFSPRIALSVQPQFDAYVFCDVKSSHVDRLKRKLFDLNFDTARCDFKVGEAEGLIAKFCAETEWRTTRAVMFLDPYGLQVGWRTLELIAATKAIDLWYLFPSGLGLFRMTPRSGVVPDNWAMKLTEIWGSEEWRTVAYAEQLSDDLFGERNASRSKASVASFEAAFMKRLMEIFPGVSRYALRLQNSKGFDMFSLIFVCSNPNPKALGPALNIANHIVQMRR